RSGSSTMKRRRAAAMQRKKLHALPGHPGESLALPELLRLEVITLGDLFAERYHTTPSHELIHVLEGRARIQYRHRSFRVGPGDTFIIPQGMPHRDIREQSSNYRVLYLFFRWPEGMLRSADPDLLIQLPAGKKARLHQLMKDLEEEYLGEGRDAHERMRLLLLE